jgi:hypothetical protein
MSQTVDLEKQSPNLTDDPGHTELRDRVVAVQRLESRRRWGTSVCLVVLVTVSLAGAVAIGDYLWPLATIWRALALVMIGAIGGWMAFRAARRCRYTTGDAAADVETAFPRYGQRLRTTLDYAEHPLETARAAPSLLRALHAETRQIAAPDDFSQASSPGRFYLAVGTCLLVMVIAGLCLLCVPELRVTAGRLFLLPLDYTYVSVGPIEQPIPQGEDALVEVEVQGRPIRQAVVRYRRADSQDDWQQLPLLPPGADPEKPPTEMNGKLSTTIVDCRHDLEVLVAAGPRAHPLQRIEVLPPLELRRFTAHVQPPDYLQRDAETFDSESFVVWEGSHVGLRFEMNRAPAQAILKPELLADSTDGSDDKEMAPIELTIADNVVTGELSDLRRSIRFTLDALTADQMSLDSPRFHIRVQMDKKPQIRFASPEEDLEVIPTTEIRLAVEANDDVGVTKVGVLYRIGSGSLQTLWEQDYSHSPDSLHAENTLFLEDHQLTYPDAVTYYAFAEDNYFGQPRRVATDLRFIDIRPFKREYQIIQSPGGT